MAANIGEAAQGQVGRELVHARGYLGHLVFFVCWCTLFEGYDVLILNLALPYLGKDFGASSQTLGLAVGVINIGTIAAFALVQLADCYGRRLVFLGSVFGYATFTILTAFSYGLYDFIADQFFARLFMVTELAVGCILLAEEVPARYRGAAVSLAYACGLLGGTVAGALFPHLVGTTLGWRALYVAGAAVLPVLLFYWSRVKETQRWQIQQSAARAREQWPKDLMIQIVRVFQPQHRRSVVIGASIWFTVLAWSAGSLFFFAYYVTNERGWSPAQVGATLTLGYALGVVGYLAAGPMMDRIGRRFTVSAYFICAGVSSMLCFLSTSQSVIMISFILVLMMQSLWAIAATITSEIFPTEIRGTANAVVNNLLGRIGMVVAPSAIGVLSSCVGSVGKSAAVFGILPFFCLPIVLLLLQETKNKTLEEISGSCSKS